MISLFSYRLKTLIETSSVTESRAIRYIFFKYKNWHALRVKYENEILFQTRLSGESIYMHTILLNNEYIIVYDILVEG